MAHRRIEIARVAGTGLAAGLLPVLLAGTTACSRLHPAPVLEIKQAAAPLQIDGRLTEAEWSQAQPAFLQSYNPKVQTGAFPPTRAMACWDRTHLYIAMQGEDTVRVAALTRRDDPLYNEEVMEIMLAFRRNPKRYYEFSLNALGTQYDAAVFSPRRQRQGMTVNQSWNADGWKAAVDKDAGGWTVEMAIPFSSFDRPAPGAGERWFGNFFRIELKPEAQYGSWSPTLSPAPDFHRPRRFGVLRFMP